MSILTRLDCSGLICFPLTIRNRLVQVIHASLDDTIHLDSICSKWTRYQSFALGLGLIERIQHLESYACHVSTYVFFHLEFLRSIHILSYHFTDFWIFEILLPWILQAILWISSSLSSFFMTYVVCLRQRIIGHKVQIILALFDHLLGWFVNVFPFQVGVALSSFSLLRRPCCWLRCSKVFEKDLTPQHHPISSLTQPCFPLLLTFQYTDRSPDWQSVSPTACCFSEAKDDRELPKMASHSRLQPISVLL